ncbi:MAG: lipoprotein-releasing ABC transporter permease subunit [Caulobacteraceae bacterium]
MDSARPAAPFSRWERSLALRYLLAKRSQGGVALIAVISFVAIALAVAALVITMSIMNGFRSELTGKILGFNGHAFVVPGPMTPDELDGVVKRIRALPGVIQALPVVESQALAEGPNGAAGAIVRGVRPADLAATQIIAKNIKAGSLAGFGQSGGEFVVVGDKLAQTLGVGVGEPITLLSPTGEETAMGELPVSKTFVVDGLFSVGMSEYDQAFVYMPLSEAQLFFGRGSAVDFIEVRLADPDRAPSMHAELAAASGAGAVVTDWTQRNRAYFGALQVERNVMRMILMIIVAIAAMNIISGLIMLVKNKGRDIAILRTMGAARGAILRIFFMAGAVIGVLGTALGIGVGVLFCLNIEAIQDFVQWVTRVQVFNPDVYFLSHVPAKIDWNEVVLVTIWTLAASFLATLPPALQAARLDPVEALRYE